MTQNYLTIESPVHIYLFLKILMISCGVEKTQLGFFVIFRIKSNLYFLPSTLAGC